MNPIERIAKSIESDTGAMLDATQTKELGAIIQAMQMQIASDQGRSEALTRILTVALNQVGGELNIPAFMFADAERYIIDVEWSEEGDTINARIRMADVDMSEVQEDTDSAAGSDSDPVPLHGNEAAGRVDDRTTDTDVEKQLTVFDILEDDDA